MKKYISPFTLYALFLLGSTIGFGQNSQKAKTLLDDVYQRVMGYDNLEIEFKFNLYNAETNTKSETNGRAFMQGDKYRVNLFGSTQIFDGKKVYTIVPDNEEVTVENPTTDSETITPSKMLTFYKKGHNYAWDIVQTVEGRKIQFVKLIPINSNSEIKEILLGIDEGTKHIYKLIEKGKNGTQTTITVNSFKPNQPLSKTLFTFDRAKYEGEGYFIID